jgi:mono/diheme cytochrome c family protein
VRAWQAHVDTVGVEAAGRVTGLIEAARARLDGAATPSATTAAAAPAGATVATPQDDGDAPAAASEIDPAEAAAAALEDPQGLVEVGAALYAANCATCHGSAGQGGAGPRLVNNARAGNEANVRSVIRFGRGVMPGFGATLAEAEIEVLVRWVGQELAAPR